jgi:protein SCO1/2
MNPSVMSLNIQSLRHRSLQLGAALAAALMVTGCGGSSSSGSAPLEGAAIGGPFTLVNSEGETVRWDDFDGQYRMLYFGYAYCPDVCPFDLQRMMQGYRQFAAEEPDLAAEVQPIFVTIDPERDTPEVVGEFTAAFGDELVGLTGTPEQVEQAAKAFSVYYNKGEVSEGGGYLMDHSRAAFLMGREGEPIALLPVEASGADVAAELDKWVS